MSAPSSLELVAAVCFALAVLHTFCVRFFQGLALRQPEGSVAENAFHLLGEVEVVFGIWAAVYLLHFACLSGPAAAVGYLESRAFTEPAFVFVIMVVCSTRPVLALAESAIAAVASLVPAPKPLAFFGTVLVLGPLLGSLITEPAAMTVTALILLDRVFRHASSRLRYAALGLLFVNVSIGGTLTPFAAPPVLMVAGVWGWDAAFMLRNFGGKAVLAILISTAITAYSFRAEIARLPEAARRPGPATPAWISALHLLFAALIVLSAHHTVVFIGIFLFFLGLVSATKEFQGELKLREGLLVAFFLGGLVVLGGPQRWWLEPLLASLSALPLYLGGMALTALTDNAALTYLGAQVPGLAAEARYALVAGAVVGGGLTVIANAPNPAGFAILNPAFGEEGISPLGLLRSAALPTGIAALCFWLF